MALPFDPVEYANRLHATKERMENAHVDVLLVTDPSNMNYLTGYDGWSFYVPQLVLVHIEEAQAWWIGRLMDANAAKVTTALSEDHILGYPDRYVQATDRHPMDYVADFIVQKGWSRSRIGLEMDAYYFTAAGFAALETKLTEAALIDANLLVNWVRAVKSPAEIAYMQDAARIVELTMSAAYEHIRPGVRQCDAVAEIYRAQTSGTEDFGGEYTGICPMLPTGVGTSTPHLTWSNDPFREGEATILELAGSRNRYHCPMARTLHLGPPPPKLADTAKIVLEGIESALETVQPGVEAQAVEAAWRATIGKYGLEKESRIGYSVGIGYPPDWGEHTISLRPGDTTVLEPNQVMHMIPGIWMDDWGLEVSEVFRVTDTGAQCLAQFPRDLFVRR